MFIVKRDPYMVLGVKRSDSLSDIKLAYRTLSKVYHPDKLKTGNKDKFQEI